jgi:hypothetical protein
MKTRYTFLIYLARFFLEREIFQTNVVENISKEFVFNGVFPKNLPYMR